MIFATTSGKYFYLVTKTASFIEEKKFQAIYLARFKLNVNP